MTTDPLPATPTQPSAPRRGWRHALANALDHVGLGDFVRPRPGSKTTAFTMAFVSLAAKMAKADGVAVLAEEKAFERFLDADPQDCANIQRLWNLSIQDTAGFELYAERIAQLLADEPDVKRNVLECLFCVACSDGVLHHAEDEFLRIVADRFGFNAAEFSHIRALFVLDVDSPYEILGLRPGASVAEVKARYRALARELHPDKYIAHGAEAALIKAANAKLAAVNAAYAAIMADLEQGRRA